MPRQRPASSVNSLARVGRLVRHARALCSLVRIKIGDTHRANLGRDTRHSLVKTEHNRAFYNDEIRPLRNQNRPLGDKQASTWSLATSPHFRSTE
jgi:hypothetical protein